MVITDKCFFTRLNFYLQNLFRHAIMPMLRTENEVPKEVLIMAKFCQMCGKGEVAGNAVSHSHKKVRRVWAPNVQKKSLNLGESSIRVNICTRCLRTIKKHEATN